MGIRWRAARVASCARRTVNKGPVATKSASGRSRSNGAKAAPISRPFLALRTWICRPMARAADSACSNVVLAVVVLVKRPVVSFGLNSDFARIGEFDGVADEVDQHLRQAAAIPMRRAADFVTDVARREILAKRLPSKGVAIDFADLVLVQSVTEPRATA